MSRLLAWIGFLVVAVAGLLALPIPAGDGVSTAFAGVRVVALVLGAYLLAVSVLGLLPRLLRVGAAVRVTDLVTVPFVKRLLNRAAAGLLTASLVTPVGALAAERPVEPPPVMRLIDEAPQPSQPAPPSAPAPAPDAAVHEVQPGDNLWDITEHLLAQRLGRAPTDDEIVPHWKALIADNADRVRDPSLIFSGQVLRVPASVQPEQADSRVALPRTD